MKTLTLLTRPDCGLCSEFRAAFDRAADRHYKLVERCVDERDDWRTRFGLRIPVLLDEDGRLLCATRFDPDCLG